MTESPYFDTPDAAFLMGAMAAAAWELRKIFPGVAEVEIVDDAEGNHTNVLRIRTKEHTYLLRLTQVT